MSADSKEHIGENSGFLGNFKPPPSTLLETIGKGRPSPLLTGFGGKVPPSSGSIDLTKEVKKFATRVLQQNSSSMMTLNKSVSRSYWLLRWMYLALFLVGLTAACLAIYKGFTATDASTTVPSLMFAGLSVGSFFALFLIRPLESLERSTFFSSWIIAIANTYWTQVAYLENADTFKQDLEEITENLVIDVTKLVDKYTEVMGKLPSPKAPRKPKTQPGGGGGGGGEGGKSSP